MLELIILDKGLEITGDDNFRMDKFIESRPGALQGLRCEMRLEQFEGKIGCKDKASVAASAGHIGVVVEDEVEDWTGAMNCSAVLSSNCNLLLSHGRS